MKKLSLEDFLGKTQYLTYLRLMDARGCAIGSGTCKKEYEKLVSEGLVNYKDNGNMYQVTLTAKGRKALSCYFKKEFEYVKTYYPSILSKSQIESGALGYDA